MRSVRLFVVAVLAVILAASLFSPAAAFQGIRVEKVTTNGDTTTIFVFDTSGSGLVDFQLVGGGSTVFGLLPAGEYTITEKVPDGWFVADISCEGVVGFPEPSEFEFIPGEGVVISYVAEDTVTCVFTNSPVPPPEVPPVGGVVLPANTHALFAPWLAVIGLIICIGTAVVVAKRRQG
jgi:hypothetical protein